MTSGTNTQMMPFIRTGSPDRRHSIPEIFQYDFMVRAMAGAAIVGAVAPALGVFMVLRRLSLIADTLSHVALAGVAVGIISRTYPPYVALAATSAAAVSIEQLRSRRLLPGDAALAVFLYGSLAVAVVILSVARGFNSSLYGFLFGSVLTVTARELWLAGAVGVAAFAFVWILFSELGQTSFDTDLARINGVRVNAVATALAVITGAVITVSMQMVGVLLVGAMLVVPSLVALRLSTGLGKTVAAASVTGLVIALGGVATSFYADIAPGGAVVLVGIGALIMVESGAFLMSRIRKKPSRRHSHALTDAGTEAGLQLELSTRASNEHSREPYRQ